MSFGSGIKEKTVDCRKGMCDRTTQRNVATGSGCV